MREGGVRPGVSAQAGPRFSPGGGSGAARVREGGVRPGVSAQAGPHLSPGGGSGGSPGYREAEELGRRPSRGPHDGGRAPERMQVRKAPSGLLRRRQQPEGGGSGIVGRFSPDGALAPARGRWKWSSGSRNPQTSLVMVGRRDRSGVASASERAAVRTPSYERREQRERIRPEAAGPNLGLPHRKQLASWASTSRAHLGGPVKQMTT